MTIRCRVFVASWVILRASFAAAQPLVIVAPAAPGGGWDQTARALQQALTTIDARASVQVENIPGAAGTIGLARFAGSERGNPDALMVTGLVMLSAITMNGAPVSLADTTPIARLTGEPEVIVVPAESPFRTLNELIAAFRRAPATVSWGGGSAGGTDDLLVRLLAERVGVPPGDAVYIAFAGGGPALAALLGGQVSAGVSGYSEFAGQIEAGTIRPLAVSSPSAALPAGMPTLRDLGIDLEMTNWRGLVAPPGLSDAERDALVARVARVAGSEAWRALLARHGWDDLWLAGPSFRQFLIAEQHRVDSVLARLSDQGAGLPRSASTAWLTPMTAPIVTLVAVAALLVTVLVRPRAPSPPAATRAWALAAVLAGHAVAFPLLGFVPASTALFVVSARLVGSRRPGRDTAIGAITALALYAIFTAGLGLSLPLDPMTRWARG
jgi:putative tricarboxylic transport membrane protein